MSLRKSAPTPTAGTSSGSSCVWVSGSVATGRPSSSVAGRAVMRSCGGKVFDWIDRLAEAADLEMQLDLIRVGIAHFADLLSLGDLLAFLDRGVTVVRVC